MARKNADSIQQYINADVTAHKGRDTWVLIADYRQVIDTHYTVPRGDYGVLIMTQNNLQFCPLEQLTRPTVTTEEAAFYLNRKPQTLRSWASAEPAGVPRPVRISGRLAWSVADIRALLNGEGA